MPANTRFCPLCGAETAAAFCPADQVATFTLQAQSDAAVFAPGDLIAGKYRVLRKLGQGGFGAVYEADHTGGLGKVALKMLALADQSIEDVRRFYREAQVTAQLRHANTVRVFDVGQAEGGALFIAMELLTGKSLEETIKTAAQQGRVVDHEMAIAIAIDVLKSLSEAHGKGLVHRDLKPANLMLTDVDGDLVVKVLDFGIAHVQDSSLTGTGRALGTPAYMSPEQCTAGNVDARSDLYALGVILFRCVCGRAPFVDPNPLTVMFAHASQEPPELLTYTKTPVSEAFAMAVMRALSKSPELRFASAKEMRLALEFARSAPLLQPIDGAVETADFNARQPLTPGNLIAVERRPSTTTAPKLVVTAGYGELATGAAAASDQTSGLTADGRSVSQVFKKPSFSVSAPNIPVAELAPAAAAASPVPVTPKSSGASPRRFLGLAVALFAGLAALAAVAWASWRSLTTEPVAGIAAPPTTPAVAAQGPVSANAGADKAPAAASAPVAVPTSAAPTPDVSIQPAEVESAVERPVKPKGPQKPKPPKPKDDGLLPD